MVEQFNQSLLQLMKLIGSKLLIFGRQLQTTSFDTSSAFDPASHQCRLTAKIEELHDFVESKLVLAASKQKSSYDKKCNHQSERPCLALCSHFRKVGSEMEGNCMVSAIKSCVQDYHQVSRESQACSYQFTTQYILPTPFLLLYNSLWQSQTVEAIKTCEYQNQF